MYIKYVALTLILNGYPGLTRKMLYPLTTLSLLHNIRLSRWCCGQYIEAEWRHLATENWVNIGSDNDLLSDGTKPLPAPMLTNH